MFDFPGMKTSSITIITKLCRAVVGPLIPNKVSATCQYSKRTCVTCWRVQYWF